MKFEKIGPGVSEEKSFKGVDDQTDGRRMASDYYSAQVN